MNNSNFWLKYEPEGKFNLLELANTQRAITNFVKILTEKKLKSIFSQIMMQIHLQMVKESQYHQLFQ